MEGFGRFWVGFGRFWGWGGENIDFPLVFQGFGGLGGRKCWFSFVFSRFWGGGGGRAESIWEEGREKVIVSATA